MRKSVAMQMPPPAREVVSPVNRKRIGGQLSRQREAAAFLTCDFHAQPAHSDAAAAQLSPPADHLVGGPMVDHRPGAAVGARRANSRRRAVYRIPPPPPA